MGNPRYILDTGPLVAFANVADEHHAWAVEVLNSLGDPPVTCEVVLAEACHLLGSSPRAVDLVLALPEEGRVVIEPTLDGESDGVRFAVAKYWPIMDVADGCVLQIAERYPRACVITTDRRDFGIYRRREGQSLRLIHPASNSRGAAW